MGSETTAHRFVPLETRRLLLRPLTHSDIASVFHLYADWDVSKNLSRLVFPFTYQAAQQFITTAQTDLVQARAICWGCFSGSVTSLWA